MDDDIKYMCDCGKEVVSVYTPSDNFKFAGFDEENNPFFKCIDCEVYVWG